MTDRAPEDILRAEQEEKILNKIEQLDINEILENVKQGIMNGLRKARRKRILCRLYDDPNVELHLSKEHGSGWAIVDGVRVEFAWSEDNGIFDDTVEAMIR